MDGTDAATGKKLGGIAHLRQSIRDILSTPIGTRVMRRDYGSELFDLIDAPMNPETLLRMTAATAKAIKRWESRYLVTKVARSPGAQDGGIVLDLTGTYLPDGTEVKLDGIVVK